MKVKKNNLLGLAVLVPFLLLAGCGDDSPTSNNSNCPDCNVLTSTQREALGKLSGKAFISPELDGTETAHVRYTGSGFQTLTAEAKGTLTAFPDYGLDTTNNAERKYVDLDGGSETDDKVSFEYGTPSIKYTATAAKDSSGKSIYYKADDDSIKTTSVKTSGEEITIASYSLDLPISIFLDGRGSDSSIGLMANLYYDTKRGNLDSECNDTPKETAQSAELMFALGRGTGVYVALSSNGSLLICK